MADFYQTGVVTTLHRLDREDPQRSERQLEEYAPLRPAALVLPALYTEFEHPAMRRIVEELASVRFLKRIVVALGRASDVEYRHARSFFEGFSTPVTFLQVDHPATLGLFDELEANGLSAGTAGKGRSCWLASGYVQACRDCEVIAMHDCDIRNYSRSLLTRLCLPLMHPALRFDFCKGFYSRHSDRLHGRVTRLFLTPLIRAMHSLAPGAAFLKFIDSFRYALSGEFSMTTQLAAENQVPGDWGLEVGVLAEVFRNCPASRVCQTDLADCYDHKHQALSADNPGAGLRRMTCEIARSLLRTVASEGIVVGGDALRTLQATYVRSAEDMIRRYQADALVNGLRFDQQAERCAVHAFAASLQDAVSEFLENPLGATPMPSWNLVESALPELPERLLDTVAQTDRPARVRVALRRIGLTEEPAVPSAGQAAGATMELTA
ncbi:MAG: hypothetical protein SFV54_23270 [Bryobacteraceae bacterium]|nr:hypothetical protein [Bryobacteraceae bacterium]